MYVCAPGLCLSPLGHCSPVAMTATTMDRHTYRNTYIRARPRLLLCISRRMVQATFRIPRRASHTAKTSTRDQGGGRLRLHEDARRRLQVDFWPCFRERPWFVSHEQVPRRLLCTGREFIISGSSPLTRPSHTAKPLLLTRKKIST